MAAGARAIPGSGATAQRRYLTILFADLSGSTRLAANMDAEDFADLLGALRATYDTIVARHGGTIVRIDGDGVAVIFGQPQSREDDGRRAAETALDLRDAARRIAVSRALPGLELHSGIHSGLVLVDRGDQVRGAFEMLGDATNVAARLADAAAPGEILASEAALGAERNFFTLGERRLLALAGRDRAIAAYPIAGRAGIQTRYQARAERGLAPFAGRTAELERMAAAFAAVAAGAQRLLVVTGPAGQGKTRLVEEFLARIVPGGGRVHRAYCESYLRAEPLQPFLLLACAALGIEPGMTAAKVRARVSAGLADLDTRLAGHGPALTHLLARGAGRAAAAGDVTAALCGLFARLAEQAPLVLFLDDWHEADDASRLILDAMRAAIGGRLLVLLTTREPASGIAGVADADVLALERLTAHDANATIVALLPALDPFSARQIEADAGGNPLFLEELCHSMASGEQNHRAHSGSSWLDRLIESRFARLPDEQAALVRTAAVIGNVVPVWLLRALTGTRSLPRLLDALAADDFIYHDARPGMLRFKHGVARDVIYHAVGRSARRDLHLAVADALRRRDRSNLDQSNCEALAYHYAAGEDHAEAAYFAELAGNRAMAASALDRAQGHYRAAMATLDRMPQDAAVTDRRQKLLRRFFQACIFDPSRDQIAVFEDAIARADRRSDRSAAVTADYWIGCILYALGEPHRSIPHCTRALAAAEDLGDARLVAQVRATLGQVFAAACDYDRARILLDEAIATKRARHRGNRPATNLAYSLGCKAIMLADIGDFADAEACFEEAVAIGGDTNEMASSVLGLRCMAALMQGRLEVSLDRAAQAAAVSLRVRSRYNYAMQRALIGLARWLTTRDPAMVKVMTDATGWLQSGERLQFISINHGWLAQVLLDNGRVAEARRHAALALRRARKGDRLGESVAWRALAWAAAQGHVGRPAAQYLDRALTVAEARGSRRETATTRMCQAEMALLGGDRARASALLDLAQPAFEAMAMPRHLAEAARLRAAL